MSLQPGDRVLISEADVKSTKRFAPQAAASIRHWYCVINTEPILIAMPPGHGIPLEEMHIDGIALNAAKQEPLGTTFLVLDPISPPTFTIHFSKKYKTGDKIKTKPDYLEGRCGDKFYQVVCPWHNGAVIAVPWKIIPNTYAAEEQWPDNPIWVAYLLKRYPNKSFPVVPHYSIAEVKQYRSVYPNEFNNGENKCVSF